MKRDYDGSLLFDLRTFSGAMKLAMASEGMTGQITVDVGEAGTLTVWVGQPNDDDFEITVSIRKADAPRKEPE